MNILVVEDEPILGLGVGELLRRNGQWSVDLAFDGGEALRIFAREQHQLVLIARSLPQPGPDGLEVCKRIRAASTGAWLMFIAGARSLRERVGALEAGADELITKPCQPEELFARVRAVARRSSRPPSQPVTHTELRLSTKQRKVFEHLLSGLANKEIAAALGCSVKNVEYHVARIMKQAGCSGRGALMARAWQQRVRKESVG